MCVSALFYDSKEMSDISSLLPRILLFCILPFLSILVSSLIAETGLNCRDVNKNNQKKKTFFLHGERINRQGKIITNNILGLIEAKNNFIVTIIRI